MMEMSSSTGTILSHVVDMHGSKELLGENTNTVRENIAWTYSVEARGILIGYLTREI